MKSRIYLASALLSVQAIHATEQEWKELTLPGLGTFRYERLASDMYLSVTISFDEGSEFKSLKAESATLDRAKNMLRVYNAIIIGSDGVAMKSKEFEIVWSDSRAKDITP
jgi:hypothetical protein